MATFLCRMLICTSEWNISRVEEENSVPFPLFGSPWIRSKEIKNSQYSKKLTLCRCLGIYNKDPRSESKKDAMKYKIIWVYLETYMSTSPNNLINHMLLWKHLINEKQFANFEISTKQFCSGGILLILSFYVCICALWERGLYPGIRRFAWKFGEE